MVFRPNQMGVLRKKLSRDVRGQITYGLARPCPFGVINMEIGALKTSVRADSSASRGSADETVAERAKILIAKQVDVAVSDRFEFDGLVFEIAARHVRRSVSGAIDHFECDLELLP